MIPYGEPGMLIGGFTTQNSDAEWSDGRQVIFGGIILDYYRETGKPEYLERGVAAIRAQFNINPSENFFFPLSGLSQLLFHEPPAKANSISVR